MKGINKIEVGSFVHFDSTSEVDNRVFTRSGIVKAVGYGPLHYDIELRDGRIIPRVDPSQVRYIQKTPDEFSPSVGLTF